MGFPSYAADGSDTYKPPKSYTAEELRAIRDLAREGENRFYEKMESEEDPLTMPRMKRKLGPLINPQEAAQILELQQQENALDQLARELETFGDSPTTKEIFGK